jgi:hypothetical protein
MNHRIYLQSEGRGDGGRGDGGRGDGGGDYV